MTIATTDDKKILQALAFISENFSKGDILTVAKALGYQMRNTKDFLKEYMDNKRYIIHTGKQQGVDCYILSYTVWKDILSTMPQEDYEKLSNASLGVGSYRSKVFSKVFWLFINNKPIDPSLVEIMNNFFPWDETNIIRDYIRHMMCDRSLLSFFALVKNDLQGIVFDKIKEDLITQNFTADDIQNYLLLLDLIEDDEGHDMPCLLKERIKFDYRFLRLMEIPGTNGEDKCKYKCWNYFYDSFLLLQKGMYDDAVKLMFKNLKDMNRKFFGNVIMDFYYAVALTHSTLPAAVKRRNSLLNNAEKLDINPSAHLMLMMENGMFKAGDINAMKFWGSTWLDTDRALLAFLFKRYGIEGITTENQNKVLQFVNEHHLGLLQMEMSPYFDIFKTANDEMPGGEPKLHPTLPPLEKLEEWESLLNDVLQLNNGAAAKGNKTAAKNKNLSRIVYELNTDTLYIQPRLQKSKDGVTWSAGRNVSLEKFNKGTADGIEDIDRPVAAQVSCYSYGWYNQTQYELYGGKAIAALVGNPNVYDATTGQHLDVVEEKPVLTVTKKKRYVISTDVKTEKLSGGYYISTDTPQKVKVVKVPAKLKKTIELLKQVSFPEEAKDKLTKALELVSNDMVVMSDLIKANENISNKHTHPETVVQLQPDDGYVYCHTFVRPFGSVPPLCKPGKGMQVITTSMDGNQVQTKRNLKKETENFEAVKSLLVDCDAMDDYSWTLTPEECLLLLEQLQPMQGQCTVEWPEGGQMTVVRPQLQPADFNISVGNIAGWFEISGDIQIDEKKKMKLAELVNGINNSKGDFISLGDNEFVRITAQLRKYLDKISHVASLSKGKLRVSPFNVPLLEELGKNGMNIKADEAYTSLIKRIEEADSADIRIPRAINADLRDYQKDGYRWMSRLAAWGAGALLADDMGLGKTLQTITLLLSRAAQGPQLVVVPTSLVMNWREEIARFAPSLNVSLLNTCGDAREQIVGGAKKYDVVIVTYGLLVTEEELLTGREWTTVVLDEAHTIKNRETKMSKTAMKLQAKFRILLTGTPLQNHLSEIWNLMQFANPSLLGSYQEFTDRFILPIERDHDKERQQLLKRIISPFLLRRTKSEVLNELPEKTEVTIKVELSADEWAFYDNIRQQALAAMENSENNAMQALAEITRLRQAACDVRLVEKKLNLESSKQEAFMQLVSDLHDNHHRALVFSQFTSHLALIRQRLDKEGVEYLYLDGSTSAKERISLVDQFQHGDMPIFLISLKAGGLGLNLTAADYIVHLDPWWNPAIEDQASDRAYRIGQQNPVTIYRLIAAGTIEEKIISLHQTKKNLADALLEGSDVSAAMTRDEMLALLKETM